MKQKIIIICWLQFFALLSLSDFDSGIRIGGQSQAVFIFLLSFLFSYLSMLSLSYQSYKNNISIPISKLVCLSCLISSIGVSPWIDDDIYRYMWDGYLTTHHYNPLEHPPSLGKLDFPQKFYEKISYPYVPSIYPPGAQILFQVLWITCSQHIQLWFLFFGVSTSLCLLLMQKIMNLIKQPQWFQILILMNPLFIKEFADTAHIDILAIFMICIAIFITLTASHSTIKKFAISTLIAFGTLIKIFPLLWAPVWPHTSYRHRFFITIIGSIMTIALWLWWYEGDFHHIQTFFKNFLYFRKFWVFNPNATDFLRYLTQQPDSQTAWLWASSISRFISYLCLGTGYILSIYRPSKIRYFTSFFGFFIILQPAVNTWYLLWLWPFLAITPFMHISTWAPWVFAPFFLSTSYLFWVDLTDWTDVRRLSWALWIIITCTVFTIERFKNKKKI